MDAAWKDMFEPWILARGQKYYSEGKVSKLKQEGNFIVANVAGSKVYNIEIELSNGSADFMSCSCPHCQSGNNCKHLAAVLFAIENGNFTFTDAPAALPFPIGERIPLGTQWIEAIAQLPEAVVRKELENLAQNNQELQLRLTLLHTRHLPEGQLNNWKVDIQELASSLMNRSRYIREENCEEFIWMLTDDFRENLAVLTATDATMDAFYYTGMVYQTAMEIPMEIDTDRYPLMDLCEEAWIALLAKAAPEQLRLMHQWFWEHRNEDWPFAVMYDTFFLDLDWPEDLHQENLRLCELYGIDMDWDDR